MAGSTSGIGVTAVIDSYRDAPSSLKMRAEEMAAAGFIYGGSGDFTVKCQSCSIVLNCNDTKTDPWQFHIRDSPACPYVTIIRRYILKSTSTGERKHDRCLTEALSSAISSFDEAPPLLKDRAARFSMAGFVYTGELHEIECQSCGLYNSNINQIVEDDPDVWHGRFDTKCAHQELLKKYSLINVAGSQNLMTNIESFERAPPVIRKMARRFALAGFKYTGTSDRVICSTCNITSEDYISNVDPWHQHRTCMPNCKYVQFLEKYEIVDVTNQDLATKCASFENAPISLKNRSGELALAGFEFTGIDDDQIMCFTCGLQFSTPSEDFNAFDIHLCLRPECSYMQLLQDYEIIKVVDELAEHTVEIVQELPANTPSMDLCSICMEGTRDIALIPCGHTSTCSACATNISYCPICRNAVESTLKIFF